MCGAAAPLSPVTLFNSAFLKLGPNGEFNVNLTGKTCW